MDSQTNLPQLKTHELELLEIKPLIRLEAQKCHRLLKKPTIHDVIDLVQDGVVLFYRAYELYPTKVRPVEFRRYFHRALINELTGILINSYRQPEAKDVELIMAADTSHAINPYQACRLLDRLTGLSEKARRYMNACLDLPDTAQAEITVNLRREHIVIRQILEIDWEESSQIRKEIRAILSRQRG